MPNLESVIGASSLEQAGSAARTAERKSAKIQEIFTASETGTDELHALASTETNPALSTPDDPLALSTVGDSLALSTLDDSLALSTVGDSLALSTLDDSVALSTLDDSVALSTLDESLALTTPDESLALSIPDGALPPSTTHESPVRCAQHRAAASLTASGTAPEECHGSTNTEATQALSTSHEVLNPDAKPATVVNTPATVVNTAATVVNTPATVLNTPATVVNTAACGQYRGGSERGLSETASGLQGPYFSGTAPVEPCTPVEPCKDGQSSGSTDEGVGRRLTSPFQRAAMAVSSPFQQHATAAGEAAGGTSGASAFSSCAPTTAATGAARTSGETTAAAMAAAMTAPTTSATTPATTTSTNAAATSATTAGATTAAAATAATIAAATVAATSVTTATAAATTTAATAAASTHHSSAQGGDAAFKQNASCDQQVFAQQCGDGGGNGGVCEVDEKVSSSSDGFDSESTSEESGGSEMDDCEPEMDGRKTERVIRKLSRMLSTMEDTLLTTTSSRKASRTMPLCLSAEDLRDPPEEEDFHNWPDAPVLLRPSANAAPYQVLSPSSQCDPQRQRVRGNDLEGLDFCTPLFKGKLLLLMDGLPSTPPGVFNGKKRRTWMVVQGKFQRDVSFDDLMSGQEFERRLENLPADWFVDKVLLQIARRINSSMVVGLLSQPSMMSPVASLAQIINVAPEGSAPDPLSAEEDMRLFDPELVEANGAPMSSNHRRKFFASPKNRAGRHFDPEHVWTFHVWQQFVDMSKYQLDLGITKYSLTRHLAGQPLQFSFKDNSTGHYMFAFDICHQCLLQGA